MSLHIVGRDDEERSAALSRAAQWFHDVERTCSRFDPSSELTALSSTVGRPVDASATLFEAVRFALAVAEESEGAFDPTVGHAVAELGFDRDHRSGNPLPSGPRDPTPGWRDVEVDIEAHTITLHSPVMLDLGAVAKGLAIDMAARELEAFENFAVDAGGDLFLGGHNENGEAWTVGIRHPREPELIEMLRVSDVAVCTSGDYERVVRLPGRLARHHIVDPRDGGAASGTASVTVVAPSAMVADALATAAFVLGPADGIALLERHGLDGMMVTPALERFATTGMRANYHAPGGR